jgi:H+/Cl- antiporter ClcA
MDGRDVEDFLNCSYHDRKTLVAHRDWIQQHEIFVIVVVVVVIVVVIIVVVIFLIVVILVIVVIFLTSQHGIVLNTKVGVFPCRINEESVGGKSIIWYYEAIPAFVHGTHEP